MLRASIQRRSRPPDSASSTTAAVFEPGQQDSRPSCYLEGAKLIDFQTTLPSAWTSWPQLDFAPDKLEQSYGSHNGYVQRVTKDVKRLAKEGFLLPEAAREQIAAARVSTTLT